MQPGRIDKRYSRWLHDAFDLRQKSDYGDRLPITDREAAELLEHAETFFEQVRELLVVELGEPFP